MIVPWCDDVEVVVKRAILEQRGIIKYCPRPLESLNSSDILVPGVYGFFNAGGGLKRLSLGNGI